MKDTCQEYHISENQFLIQIITTPNDKKHWLEKGSVFTKNAFTLVNYCQAPDGRIFRLSTVLECSDYELSRYVWHDH